jgi:hypothetical protein
VVQKKNGSDWKGKTEKRKKNRKKEEKKEKKRGEKGNKQSCCDTEILKLQRSGQFPDASLGTIGFIMKR